MISKARKRTQRPKNIGYIIIKNKNKISVILALLTIFLGTIGFVKNSNDIWFSIINSIKLFGLDFPSNPENLNWYIYIAIILVIITLTFTIALIFVKDGLERYQRYITNRNDHIAVFGLGEASVSFLNSYSKEQRKERIIIIESDPNNKKLDEYRDLGYGVLVGDSLSDTTLRRLNFKKMKYALIAMGNDGINIELAKRIIKMYKAEEIKTEIKIIVHILVPDLDTLFIQNLEDEESLENKTIDSGNSNNETAESIGVFDRLKKKVCQKQIDSTDDKAVDKKKDKEEESKFKIDIKVFSFFNEAAESLFEEHCIDGDNSKYVQSDEPFKTILIGNGQLVKSIIYQIALLSHLPEENTHKVYIVDRYATSILVEIKKHLHYSKSKFPSLKIKAVDIDKGCNEYFANNIWNKTNLVNIIIAYDNEAENLNLAIELFNRTFRSKSIEKEDEIPKIIFAVYDQLLLSEIINSNKEAFKHFYTYGNSEKVLSYKSLIEEEKDMLAQLIHSGYKGEYKPEISNNKDGNKRTVWDEGVRYLFCNKTEVDSIKTKWYNTAEYVDKLASIAQAKHIDVKLKAMGFRRRYVFENTKDSFIVSFIGSIPNQKGQLDSMKLNKIEDEHIGKSNNSCDKCIGKQISYRFDQKGRRSKADKEEQQSLIKDILFSINSNLLSAKFENERVYPLGIDDSRLEKYTEKLTLCSNIKDEYNKKLREEIELLKKETKQTNNAKEDKQNLDNEIKELSKKSKEYCLEKLKEKGVDKIDVAYFPASFDTLFEKMIRMEHNRWIAYHHLNGWEYSDVKNKVKKEHNCLVPLEDFEDDAMKKSVIYDIYSFLYLPKFLAEAGYEIEAIEDCAKKI